MEKVLEIYHCGWERCEPGHQYGPALRDHYLLHCVLQGEGVYHVYDQEYHLRAGQGFLIQPGVITTYRADRDNPWYYVWVGFNGMAAGDILKHCGLTLKHPILEFEDPAAVESVVLSMKHDFDEGCGQYRMLSLLYAFFALLEKQMDPEMKKERYNVVSEAIDYMNRNYSYGVTIDQMARQLGTSRSQMFRQFKKEMGISPQEYLLRFRLERSKELLRDRRLTIGEVMRSAGFQDLSNFSRQFKRRYGVSPREYQLKGL